MILLHIINNKHLVPVKELKKLLEIFSVLTAIILPDKDSWLGIHHKVADSPLAYEIRNGGGDDMYIVFSEQGCIIKGFDHESKLSPHAQDEYGIVKGIYDDVPAELLSLLDDEMFYKEDVTFCIWQTSSESDWYIGEAVDPDDFDDGGKGFLLGYIELTGEAYKEWADSYYDIELPLDALEKIYAGEKVTAEIIAQLNPKRDINEVLKHLI